jgi:hypothetical protein
LHHSLLRSNPGEEFCHTTDGRYFNYNNQKSEKLSSLSARLAKNMQAMLLICLLYEKSVCVAGHHFISFPTTAEKNASRT